MHCIGNGSFQVHSVQYNICEIHSLFFRRCDRGWQLIFADVTSCAFDDVTTVVNEIFFDDVTANLHFFDIFSAENVSFRVS